MQVFYFMAEIINSMIVTYTCTLKNDIIINKYWHVEIGLESIQLYFLSRLYSYYTLRYQMIEEICPILSYPFLFGRDLN